jgi:hypothetical protein
VPHTQAEVRTLREKLAMETPPPGTSLLEGLPRAARETVEAMACIAGQLNSNTEERINLQKALYEAQAGLLHNRVALEAVATCSVRCLPARKSWFGKRRSL